MRKTIINLYAKTFSKPPLSKLNNRLLNATLRARGYNNYRNDVESGEEFFLSKVLAPSNPKICIDVGANVGNYTRKLLQYTQATVVSFEPLPSAFEQLREQTKKFGERSIIENRGVGERNDKLVIHYNPNAIFHASFSEDAKKVPYLHNENEMEVEVVSIDSYLENKNFDTVDFIKIDTEGFELEVFRGAKDTIRRYKPQYLQMEFNWHQMFRNTSLNYFSELLPDYDVYQLLPNGWIKRNPKDPLANIYHFSNFVFVLK